MLKTIISDTSCLIVLTKIDELDLLQKVYGQIVTTLDVASEYGEPLSDWISIATVSDKYSNCLGSPLEVALKYVG